MYVYGVYICILYVCVYKARLLFQLKIHKGRPDEDDQMAKMPFEAGGPKGGLRLRRWLIGLLIFLLASLLAINSFTIGHFRIAPLGSAANQGSTLDILLFISSLFVEISISLY